MPASNLARRIALQFCQRNGCCNICEYVQWRYFSVSWRERKEEHGKKNLSRCSVVQDLSHRKETKWPSGTDTATAGTSLRQFIISVHKQDGSNYEPSLLQCMVASIERYLKRKSYGFLVINSIEFAGNREVLKAKQKVLKSSGKGNKPNASRSLTDSEVD